jgi:multidrug resistance protein
MNAEFHNTSSILSTLTVSIFILGFAVRDLISRAFIHPNILQVGPLILSPLSEIYGRRPVLNYSNAFLTVWQLAGALAPNLGSLIVFRFLAGLGGSACLSIGGGVIADLFPIEQRGLAQAIFVLGPLFGPVVGPIIGGFIAERAGWRWVYWVLLMACGAFSLGFFILGKETNAVVLIRAKTKKLRKESGNPDLQSAYDADKDPSTLTTHAVLKRGIIRPFRMLFSSPILPLLALYMSFVFSLVYLIFTTVTSLFISVYHWDPELCGLAYLGVGLGFMIGMVAVASTSDSTVVRLTKANKGVYQPEMRLATSLFYAFFIPISFFWYGWSAEKHTHWIVPILGLLPFGFGTMGIFAAIQTYFIDASGQYAASAMAGLTAVRCLFATFLPLAGPYMYASLGLGWGNSLLGFIALGLIPAPALIYTYGGKMREKYPIRID